MRQRIECSLFTWILNFVRAFHTLKRAEMMRMEWGWCSDFRFPAPIYAWTTKTNTEYLMMTNAYRYRSNLKRVFRNLNYMHCSCLFPIMERSGANERGRESLHMYIQGYMLCNLNVCNAQNGVQSKWKLHTTFCQKLMNKEWQNGQLIERYMAHE